MLKTLTIDTSTSYCAIGLSVDGLLTQKTSSSVRDHAAILLPTINDLLRASSLKVKDLDLIGVVTGPGSFTGIRIGVGVAQGLSASMNIPAIGVSSLAAMAYAVLFEKQQSSAWVALEARENEVYCASYVNVNDECAANSEALLPIKLLGEEQVATVDDIRFHCGDSSSVFAVGNGWKYKDKLEQSNSAVIGATASYTVYEDVGISIESVTALAQWQYTAQARSESSAAADSMHSLVLPNYLKEYLAYKH